MEYSTEELIRLVNDADPRSHSYVGALEMYRSLIIYYQSAIDEVETKLKIIDRELNNSPRIGRSNTIHQIQSRVKTLKSIVLKLDRKNLEFSKEIVADELSDVAGIRVICAYVDDIYMVLESLSHQSDLKIVEIKDYIIDPKPSGYRSLHVIVEIPVFFFKETKNIKVEIQFRTIAMDYWASLEHGLRYKKGVDDEKLSNRLVETAEVISNLEMEMLAIRNGIDGI
ncbi:MAG: (p)ppGpp synthetase [Vagococcus sp.]|uniref:GTP pyrophosphokinase n=1 Tax=Vagococcus sp. TaxID=1933889 RepID=UPI002FCA11F5